jgi:glutamate/tyrosine decarboxylase-like PLP-dependent enzyme
LGCSSWFWHPQEDREAAVNRSEISDLAFIDPAGGNRESVEALFRKALAIILASTAGAGERAPIPRVKASDIPDIVPEEPLAEDELLAQLEAALSRCVNPAHPGYLAHMDPPSATASIVADLAASTVNNNMLSVELSPFFSRLEAKLVRAIAARFGLGEKAGGMMLAGGTLANLQALTVARNAAFNCQASGISGLSRPPVMFASNAAHTSIHKAAMLLGLGMDAVVPVAVDEHCRMKVEDLEQAIERARREGQAPFCVVATAGTTITGSIDPLGPIGAVARRHGLWFHIDAVFGGALVFSQQERFRLDGIETADSVSFNPQKWLYVAKTAALSLFRDADVLERNFRVPLPYMEAAEQVNYGEIGIQGTRYPDAFKLWLTLTHIGSRGFGQLIDGGYRLAKFVCDEVAKRPFLELAGEPELNIVCFRGVPEWVAEDQRDAWNSRLRDHLLRNGSFQLSFPLYRTHRWLRAVLLNPYLDASDLGRMFAAIDEFVEQSAAEASGSHTALR